MKKLAYTPLALSVASVLFSPAALAETQTPETNLSVLTVIDRQGAKIKTDVVTTAIKDENTSTDLRGLLQGEPSIDFSGGNGTSQYLNIRGMGQNSVDIKVDNAYSDSQILYHQGRHMLDPSLVKVVAVQKGAGSASAGIGQTNGAIIAKTLDAQDLLKGSDKDWGLKVNAGYSTNSEHSYGLTGFGRAGDFDLLLSYHQVNQDNYKPGKKAAEIVQGQEKGKYNSRYSGSKCEQVTPNGNAPKGTTIKVCQDPNHPSDEVAFSALDKASYLVKAGYNLGDHRFVLSHFNTTNKGKRNVREEFEWFAGNDARYRELSLENTNLEYKAKNIGYFSGIEANAYVMKNTRVSDDDYNSNYAGGVTGRNTTSVETKGLNINFDSNITDNTLLKYGVNYRHQEVNPNRQGNAFKKNTEKTDTGVYVEAIHDIGQFTLTGGLRYDRFNYTTVTDKSMSNGSFSPSVGVIWQATPTLSFNATHNQATRSPRLVDALTSGGNNAQVVDDVKAERAKNNEIGFNYNQGNFFANGSVFSQKIDGLLSSGRINHGASNAFNAIDNVGYAKNKGWELNTGYRYQNLTARLGIADSKPEFYTYPDKITYNAQRGTTSPIAFSNKDFASRIGRTWTAGLAYRFDQPNVEVGINHRQTGKVTGKNAWMSTTTASDLTMVKNGYHVTDIYANWKPYNNDKLNVNFAINNITDEYYHPHNSINNNNGLPGVGREFRVGVNYQF